MTTPKDHLAVLDRRAHHLRQRIAASTTTLTWDVKELAALDWAIAALTPTDPARLPYQHQLHRLDV